MDAKTPRRLLRNDLDQFRLRTYLEELIGTDELEIVEEPTNLSDVASVVASAMTVLDRTRAGMAKPA